MSKDKISKAVISRLPKYGRCLRDLIENGIERISSEEFARLMKSSASQIRQDLNHFGGFGQQGYGYNVKLLSDEISKILGVSTPHNIICIGAGNLGRALVKYQGFAQQGFNFISLFDVDDMLCGKSVCGIKIRNMSELEKFVSKNDIDIAAITIPKSMAKQVSTRLYGLGIKNFWNFAPLDLELPEDAIVKDVHLLDSLLELSFAINESKKNNG